MKNRKIFGLAILSLFAFVMVFGSFTLAADTGAKCCPSKDTKVCQKADSKSCDKTKCSSACTGHSKGAPCPGSAACDKHASGDKCCPQKGDKDKPCCPQAADPSCCPKKAKSGSDG
jgi:hypothetical protein